MFIRHTHYVLNYVTEGRMLTEYLTFGQKSEMCASPSTLNETNLNSNLFYIGLLWFFLWDLLNCEGALRSCHVSLKFPVGQSHHTINHLHIWFLSTDTMKHMYQFFCLTMTKKGRKNK